MQLSVFAAYHRAYALTDHNIQNTLYKRFEFRKRTILADKSLTKDEKSYVVKLLNKDFDKFKILDNEGTKRICKNCHDECLATLYCEHCVRNHLKSNFSNWTSGNNDIDNLIQQCQMETFRPDRIIEWIPYNKLQDIKYLTKGGCSEIYTADWIDGRYDEWDSKEKQLKRTGGHQVILKKLENVESANRNWFEESKFHLTISNKWVQVVPCYGLTKDPSDCSDGNYMLVMFKLHNNLREYLQQNHNNLTWKRRFQIIDNIVDGIRKIHGENAIHRDLHSGNILLFNDTIIRISDLGFCGPPDKPLNSLYGNLPYIAPEVISGKETPFASDVYSIGMLMWEISSGKPPFINCEHDYELALKIINGMRPKIIPGTPLEYKELIEQCWNAYPEKRPDINTLVNKISEINRLNYQNESNENQSIFRKLFVKIKLSKPKANIISKINDTNSSDTSTSRLFTSKVHQYRNLPEPKNATEEEQEAFHSNPYGFSIPYNIIIIYQNQVIYLKVLAKNCLKYLRIMQINSSNDNQDNYKEETIQVKKV
ncbi:kinase-like domain-containing protein [Rhizophagus irregularis DAOM 181602=DAOM 197198]|nr:kinase-like domain-containing protein [Rhizophagus irregularis DAOM 181602=DAOM 197198]